VVDSLATMVAWSVNPNAQKFQALTYLFCRVHSTFFVSHNRIKFNDFFGSKFATPEINAANLDS
jgi:hypothetical protein